MRFGAPAEGKKAEKSADFSRKVVASFFADTSVRRTVNKKVVLLCACPQPTANGALEEWHHIRLMFHVHLFRKKGKTKNFSNHAETWFAQPKQHLQFAQQPRHSKKNLQH